MSRRLAGAALASAQHMAFSRGCARLAATQGARRPWVPPEVPASHFPATAPSTTTQWPLPAAQASKARALQARPSAAVGPGRAAAGVAAQQRRCLPAAAASSAAAAAPTLPPSCYAWTAPMPPRATSPTRRSRRRQAAAAARRCPARAAALQWCIYLLLGRHACLVHTPILYLLLLL
jgi:hypothetical protein